MIILSFNNNLIFLIKKRNTIDLLLIFIINFMRLIKDSLSVRIIFFLIVISFITIDFNRTYIKNYLNILFN